MLNKLKNSEFWCGVYAYLAGSHERLIPQNKRKRVIPMSYPWTITGVFPANEKDKEEMPYGVGFVYSVDAHLHVGCNLWISAYDKSLEETMGLEGLAVVLNTRIKEISDGQATIFDDWKEEFLSRDKNTGDPYTSIIEFSISEPVMDVVRDFYQAYMAPDSEDLRIITWQQAKPEMAI